ncbi:MAG: S49 family peptidase [Pontibacterium sp.]
MSKNIWGEEERPKEDLDTKAENSGHDEDETLTPGSDFHAELDEAKESDAVSPKTSTDPDAGVQSAGEEPSANREPSANKKPLEVTESSKEWRLIERTMNGLQREQRAARRWGIFFKSLTFLYLFTLLGFVYFSNEADLLDEQPEQHVALIDVNGPISANSEASADAIVGALRSAFEAPEAEAVLFRINSPGGSPVQAGYIYDEVMRLKALNPEKRVYAVITDVGASGAYYIAAAADEIYADKASLVGSIGVVAGGFGFVELIEKLGVERRLYTSGEHKAFLDPFLPQSPDAREKWQTVLAGTHQQFIDAVRKGRGERLSNDEDLFTGMVWNGEQALTLGLIDGLGSSSYVAREIVGVERLYDYTYAPQLWEQILDRVGVSFAGAIVSELRMQNGMPQW